MTDAQAAFAQATLYTDDTLYQLVRLPPAAKRAT